MFRLYPEHWFPRQIRSGKKTIPELRMKFTENESTAKGARDWIREAVFKGRIEFEDFYRVFDVYRKPGFEVEVFLAEAVKGSAGESIELLVQEIIDYVLFNTFDEEIIRQFNRYTVLSYLNWQASPEPPYQLMQRVLPEVEQNYLDFVGRAPEAASHCLKEAWRAAYGATPEPKKAWHEAVRAVETLLAPVVAPTAKKPTFGSLKSTLRQGLGKGKWQCTLPVKAGEDPCAKFLQLLEMLDYEPGRHDANEAGPSAEAARGQVQLALAICQILLDEGFKGNDEVFDEEGV